MSTNIITAEDVLQHIHMELPAEASINLQDGTVTYGAQMFAIGDEHDEDGEVDGVTWTHYHGTTDGDGVGPGGQWDSCTTDGQSHPLTVAEADALVAQVVASMTTQD